MPIPETCKCSLPLTLWNIPMQSLTSKVSAHSICQSIGISFCLSENNALSTFCMFLQGCQITKIGDQMSGQHYLSIRLQTWRRKGWQLQEGISLTSLTVIIRLWVLTVIRGPIIDAFPYMSDAIEYSEIPSANFWSESPTCNFTCNHQSKQNQLHPHVHFTYSVLLFLIW